jgi:hypothetical protein
MHTIVCRQRGDGNAVYYATYAISSYNLCITNIESKINYTGFNNNNNNNKWIDIKLPEEGIAYRLLHIGLKYQTETSP